MDEDEKRKEQTETVKGLGLKDYLAITVAALTTFLLPLVALAVVFLALVLVFALRI